MRNKKRNEKEGEKETTTTETRESMCMQNMSMMEQRQSDLIMGGCRGLQKSNAGWVRYGCMVAW